MSSESAYLPPRVAFDPQLEKDLARLELLGPTSDEATGVLMDRRRSPFNGYSRSLTAEGGILITYKDLNRSLLCRSLRVAACVALSGVCLTPILHFEAFSWAQLASAGALALANWIILKFKVRKGHAVEVRPDCMIIDGTDIFLAEDIGDENWPTLQHDPDDEGHQFIGGICGTRFIEYMTVNPLDESDRTPQVLEADLTLAFEQLWGRRAAGFGLPL